MRSSVTDRSDSDEFVVASEAATTTDRNFNDLINTALPVDRYGVSNRAAAAIINAFQRDSKSGMVVSDIVDQKKI